MPKLTPLIPLTPGYAGVVVPEGASGLPDSCIDLLLGHTYTLIGLASEVEDHEWIVILFNETCKTAEEYLASKYLKPDTTVIIKID